MSGNKKSGKQHSGKDEREVDDAERARNNLLSESTAARTILRLEELLGDQERILRRILHKTHDFAARELEKEAEAKDKEHYLQSLRGRRPRQVFFIDGARGSGKTSLLLTVREYMVWLGNEECPIPDDVRDAMDSFADKIRAQGAPDNFCFRVPHSWCGKKRKTACVLDVMFPADLEGGQPVMEGIFAFMVRKLHDVIDEIKLMDSEARRVDKAKALIKKIHGEVSRGWYLSKKEGGDAIIRDSADYRNYLEKMGEASVAAYGRVQTFRDFVHEYLDFFDAELLAVFFDDTDVSPPATQQILHAIRIFLDHPRVVTVIAGHMKSIRESLIWDGMRGLTEPMQALLQGSETTAIRWRDATRREVEEYLEKVLPRQYRNQIRVERMNELTGRASIRDEKGQIKKSGRRSARDDFSAIMGTPFDRFCAEMQERNLSAFVRNKINAYYRNLAGLEEIASEAEQMALENWIAWWLYRHRYGDQLKPRSVRQKIAMRALFRPVTKSKWSSERMADEFNKRLAVFLFESPDNHELLHRFADADSRVLRWLHRQRMSSQWRGDRYVEINGRKIYEGSYAYSFINFRVDLGIGMPIGENPDERIPPGLLGTPAGPNLVDDRPFFPRMLRQLPHGVAAELRHSVIPANCLYMSDAGCLPDVAWSLGPNERDPWGNQLIYDWPKLFFHEEEDWRSESAPVGEMRDVEMVRKYFAEVVVPYASIEIGRFVRSPVDADGPGRDDVRKVHKSTLFYLEWHGQTDKESLEHISDLRRRYDYLDFIGGGSAAAQFVQPLAHELLREWRRATLDIALPKSDGKDDQDDDEDDPVAKKKSDKQRKKEEKARQAREDRHQRFVRQLRAHRWLVNDVRKAYHAGRIFKNELAETVKRQTQGEDEGPRELTERDDFASSDRYTILTRRQIEADLAQHDVIPFWLDIGTWKEELEQIEKQIKDSKPGLRYSETDALDRFKRQLGLEKGAKLFSVASAKGVIGDPEESKHFLGLTHLGEVNSPEFIKATDRGRAARSYLLYLYGLVPCLPSLIHLEVGSVRYISGQDQEGCRKPLDQWSELIKKFLTFVRRYRVVLELFKARSDLFHLTARALREDESDSELSQSQDTEAQRPICALADVRLTFTPDISFASLGVKGLMWDGLDVRFSDDGLQAKFDALRKRAKKGLRETSYKSLFEEVEANLLESLNFIEVMREVLISDPPRGGPGKTNGTS